MRKILLSLFIAFSGAAQSGELEDHYRQPALLRAVNPTVMEAVVDYNALRVDKCDRIAGSPFEIARSETFKALLADYMRDRAAIADRLAATPCKQPGT